MARTDDHITIWLWHGLFRYFHFLGATCGAIFALAQASQVA
jgi:hypothetical protein